MRRGVVWLVVVLRWASHPAGADELTPKEATAGRKVYVAKCAKCHKFYEPKAYTDADWRRWMDAMNRKAKLKPDDDKLLRRYLDEYRAERIPKAR